MEPAQAVAVVVVPFPAQGHLNQLLHLSLLLSARGLPVYYAASATHNRQARDRVHGWDTDSIQRIHFHDLTLPPFSTPPPDPNAPTHFPSHLLPAFEASEHLRVPLVALLRSLSATSRRLIVVQEPLMSFAGHGASSLPNVEIYSFQCVPAFFQLPYLWDHRGYDAELSPEGHDVLLASFEGSFTQEFWDFAQRRASNRFVEAGTLINTCRPIEGEFIDMLVHQPLFRDKKIFTIGPLNPVLLKRDGGPRHECLDWLDRQPPASVVYVSFGTTSAMSDEQIEQLALGLQRSGQLFIWVLRDADRGDIFADSETNRQKKLPPDYERNVEGVGIIIRGWAPQLEILAHPSTGLFISHCGWNSCMESLSMGVPILAWPMHSDQPRNAMVVTNYLKVGVTVREWASQKEIVSAAETEECMKRVMVYHEGKEIRRRAKALGEAVSESGLSQADLRSFIAHITR